MPRKPRGEVPSSLPRFYEGEEAFGALLAAAGSPLGVADVKERLRAAQKQGRAPSTVFPELFEGAPRFPSPDVALQFYANLFGLWDRLVSGGPVEPAESGPVEEKHEPAPAPEPIAEGPLTEAFVEAAWRHLADLPARELDRLSHQFENSQSELTEMVSFEAGESEAAIETVETLLFELWAMLGLARPGASIPTVTVEELRRAQGESGNPEPALERYCVDSVAEAELDEETPLAHEDAEKVLELAGAAIRALAAAQRRGS
jgi:hypothetical protein